MTKRAFEKRKLGHGEYARKHDSQRYHETIQQNIQTTGQTSTTLYKLIMIVSTRFWFRLQKANKDSQKIQFRNLLIQVGRTRT